MIGIVLLFMQFFLNAVPVLDLEQQAQDFVLETKQLHIPGYAGAFNPAMVKWKNRTLLSFRVRNEHLISTFEIGLVWLDRDFNIASKPYLLKIIQDKPSPFSQTQDPRLITIHDKLYVIFNNFIKIGDMSTRRMFVGEVKYENDTFYVKNPISLHPFAGWSSRWEKNWVPFIYHDIMLLAYGLVPHRILQPLITGECVTVASSHSPLDWDWGELRGGTPGVLDGDEYVAFFHSSKKMATTHSNGKAMPHYFMGAYTYSAKPPFRITRYSKTPIVGKNFYNGPAHNTWKPLRVVFPVGCIVDDKYIWVSYGRQDFEVWIVKFDKKGLYQSLVPCTLMIEEDESVDNESFESMPSRHIDLDDYRDFDQGLEVC